MSNLVVCLFFFFTQCITEKVKYHQDPENSQQTVVTRHAWIESQFHIRALRRPIEVFIYNKFSQSCVKVSKTYKFERKEIWHLLFFRLSMDSNGFFPKCGLKNLEVLILGKLCWMTLPWKLPEEHQKLLLPILMLGLVIEYHQFTTAYKVRKVFFFFNILLALVKYRWHTCTPWPKVIFMIEKLLPQRVCKMTSFVCNATNKTTHSSPILVLFISSCLPLISMTYFQSLKQFITWNFHFWIPIN